MQVVFGATGLQIPMFVMQVTAVVPWFGHATEALQVGAHAEKLSAENVWQVTPPVQLSLPVLQAS